jgi:hypothetical protein
MAKIHQEVVVLKISKLVKSEQNEPSLLTDEVIVALEQVAQELLGDSVVIEVESA